NDQEAKNLANQRILRQTHPKTLNPDVLGEVHVDECFQFVNIPKLIGPEEIPVGTTKKRSENDKQDPENQESEQERRDFPAALFESEVAVALRIGVDVWNSHQPYDDEPRKNHAGKPRIEVHQHLLQSQEVPRR